MLGNMFGLRRKSGVPEEDKGGKKSATDIDKELAKLGIFASPEADDDDGDLEDELLALIREDDPSPSPRKPQSRSPQPQPVPLQTPIQPQRPPPPVQLQSPMSPTQLPQLPQIPSRQQAPQIHVDTDTSVVVSQPEEIPAITPDIFKAPPPPSTVMEALEQRLDKYRTELSKAADPGKSRRMGRIVKQYEDAIKIHKRGGNVDYTELPTPPGYGPIPGAVSAAITPSPSPTASRQLTPRPARAQQLPSSRPESPTPTPLQTPIQPQKPQPPVQLQSPISPTQLQPLPQTASRQQAPQTQDVTLVPDLGTDYVEIPVITADIFKAPPPPKTVMEALEQRLDKYRTEMNKAVDPGKSRRMGRIVKQYEDAIKTHKRGGNVEYAELPTPPGYGPIPGVVPAAVPGAIASAVNPGVNPVVAPAVAPVVRGGTKSGGKLSLQEKQLAVILARQKAFKNAAVAAKTRGDLSQARELLRTAKGFDKLIQVSQSGLPVDMTSLPAGPEAIAALESENFEIVSASDCIPADTDKADVFVKLEEDLKEQLKMCMRTRDHFKTMGDIGSANRFERLALDSKRDLDALRLAARKGDTIPTYHYETRIFSITECNTDLMEDDMEVNVLKGINYKNGAPGDTFVKVELPYPTAEQPQLNRTSVVQDAEYASIYKLSINRTARNFQRFVHRHGVKLEVWNKGGFLRSSTLMGVATVKLLPLETKCTIHEAFDIMEGRKSVGKLEVKVRVREPILAKQISQQKHKWLSIDRT